MSKLKIAIQKSGRLSEQSLTLLKDSGIKISNGDRKLKAEARNFLLELLYLRDDDKIFGPENQFVTKAKELALAARWCS